MCMDIFMSNTPHSFGVEEADEFQQFLETLPCAYFVITQNGGEVVACGGHGYHGKKQAVVLAWGMVRADLHKHGLGKFLLLERLKLIYKDFAETRVQIDTSQHSQGFFKKFGFEAVRVTENFFAHGIDKVEMELNLNEESYGAIFSQADSNRWTS